MDTKKHKDRFVKTFLSLLIVLFGATLLYPQITVSQSEFLEIFTPGVPLYAIEGLSGTRNIGNVGGPNEYDFTYVNMQDMFTMLNIQVSTIPELAARYPLNAHTIGLGVNAIDDNPVFYSSNDSTFFLGAATIENEYRFTHYVPGELFSTFPMVYGSSFNQFIEIWDTTYDLSWQIIQSSYYTSQQDMAVDGYGILKLPGVDLECLRLKRAYPDYGFKEFHFLTREGVFLAVSDVPINEPDTGFVFGDYVVFLSSNFVSVEDNKTFPLEFRLEQNYPNPFNPNTIISFSIPERANVNLKVYDILGNELVTLIYEETESGNYNINFNARGLPTGVYFYRLVSNEYVETKKMLLIK